jgi:hypothetical protein
LRDKCLASSPLRQVVGSDVTTSHLWSSLCTSANHR